MLDEYFRGSIAVDVNPFCVSCLVTEKEKDPADLEMPE